MGFSQKKQALEWDEQRRSGIFLSSLNLLIGHFLAERQGPAAPLTSAAQLKGIEMETDDEELESGGSVGLRPLVRRPAAALAFLGAAAAMGSLSSAARCATLAFEYFPPDFDAYRNFPQAPRGEHGTPLRQVADEPGILVDSKGQRYQRIKGGLRKVSSPNVRDQPRGYSTPQS